MNNSKYLRVVVPVTYMLLIFIASSIPGNSRVMKDIFVYDKLLHLMEYSVFGFLISWSVLREEQQAYPGWRIGLILLIGWGYGALDEIHQYFVTARTMDIHDFAADAFGIILGLGIYIILRKKFHPKSV